MAEAQRRGAGLLVAGSGGCDRAVDLGMTEVARGDDGSVYLSIGYNHHDLVLCPAKEKALLHVGFHLKLHISVSDLAREARELGLSATVKSDSQPGGAELVEVEAPGGVVILSSISRSTRAGLDSFPAAVVGKDDNILIRFGIAAFSGMVRADPGVGPR